ncbi:MAG: hypothetical protein OJF51_002040 [Nitrospira sp.]|nr:MAG: hypothetical protein OJF51_002040 [Nitrospira sp.]
MKPNSQGSNSSPNLCKLIVICSIGVLVGSGVPQVSHADEPLPAAMANYPKGTITSVYETTFQIDGRTFSLAPEAVLVDRHGDPLAPATIRVDIDVKYRIQKGTTDKIDWMLLMLPR